MVFEFKNVMISKRMVFLPVLTVGVMIRNDLKIAWNFMSSSMKRRLQNTKKGSKLYWGGRNTGNALFSRTCGLPSASSKTHPSLHSPVWVRQTPLETAVIPSERVQFWVRLFLSSASVEGQQQQQQLKTTSDVTSKFLWCCRASVLWSGKET